MLRFMRKSKIHRATVTQADLAYEGSVTIDKTLLEAADITENEKVLVINVNTGARFETYAIPGPRDSGVMCLNGGCARLGQVGDIILIITFGVYSEAELEKFATTTVHVDGRNRIVRKKAGPPVAAVG